MAKAAITATDLITDDDIATAIGNTEQEIFDEATGADPAENDGDRSLEEMDDDIPGAEDEAGDEEAESEDETGEPEAEGKEGPDAIAARTEGRPQRGIPSSRLKEEADARRAAEAEQRAAQAEARELRARLEALERGQKAPDKKDATPPDMFADPEGWAKHQRDEAKREALAEFRREQQQRDEARVASSFEEAARGSRSFEFNAAFQKLHGLATNNDPVAQRAARAIGASPDPAKALFDWWDQNGGEDFRESVRAQLIPNYRPRQQPQRAAPRETEFADGGAPQVVFRNPKSLNGATGGNQRVTDPELYDDSEGAVFRYATR